MVAGAEQYLSENASSLTLSDLFDELAVTGYWYGAFKKDNKSEVLRFMEMSEMRWKDGLEPTRYNYFNKIINEICAASVQKSAAQWLAQKQIAEKNGLGMIQYEGGNHNTPSFFDTLTVQERDRFMEFYRRCNHTTEDAQNYITMFNLFQAVGGKYPSKFVEAGPVSRYGAWGAFRHEADRNPVWDAIVAFNGRS
jgi:hypothetical protein